jgi:adenylate cyclase
MSILRAIRSGPPVLKKYRYKLLLGIAITWTSIDSIYMSVKYYVVGAESDYHFFEYRQVNTLILREVLVFLTSCGIAYLLVFRQQRMHKRKSLWVSFLLNTLILVIISFAFNLLFHFLYSILISGLTISTAIYQFFHDAFYTYWLIQKIPHWILIFLVTMLVLELAEKYSPGVFRDILVGKYLQPRIEKRIVMFLDLKDSTPIAEKLGSKEYFRFIRDFIYFVSIAMIEYNGRIYQYVGDEVVVSWLFNTRNTKKCMDALIEARRLLQRNSNKFRSVYGVVPEFRVGIHVGDVTVGEIGVIKKDIAMSGDTMNTTARIRGACSELNHKFLVSKAFADVMDFKEWQIENLGIVDLKGKKDGVELVALKI